MNKAENNKYINTKNKRPRRKKKRKNSRTLEKISTAKESLKVKVVAFLQHCSKLA